MMSARQGEERRKWSRLSLAIPVFVRARDEQGKDILEFATALNVSAGGMLVAVRRALPVAASIQLEIPSSPFAVLASVTSASRNLRAKSLRSTHEDGYYLLGLKFSRPLRQSAPSGETKRRKILATV
jgi:c-di-GMP-binding flagellar brake protein YcgR